MTYTTVLEPESVSAVDDQAPSQTTRAPADVPYIPDPSIHFLIDPPKRHPKFQSWFALAIFAGVLMALAIVAIMNG